jgi:hypothetical protein
MVLHRRLERVWLSWATWPWAVLPRMGVDSSGVFECIATRKCWVAMSAHSSLALVGTLDVRCAAEIVIDSRGEPGCSSSRLAKHRVTATQRLADEAVARDEGA